MDTHSKPSSTLKRGWHDARTHTCVACQRDLPRTEFSRKQLGKALACRRCKTCVENGTPVPEPQVQDENPDPSLKRPTVEDFTVKFGAPNWESDVTHHLHDLGVAVVLNVFSTSECAGHMNDLIDGHHKMCPELRDNWVDANCPAGPRSGLFQSVSMHLPPVWKIRTDPRVRRVFEAAYHDLRDGRKIKDFVSSCDGINIRPPGPPFYTDDAKDWAHLDQTTSATDPHSPQNNPYNCVQGQVVLSTSTACFRCSPGSVRAFPEISDVTRANYRRRGARSNWNLFKLHQYDPVRRLVLKAGGSWQIPIQVPRGAMILWLSSTVHSARLQTALPAPQPTPDDPYNGWRGVVYVCLRPQEDVDDTHMRRIADCVRYNRCSNHWGETVFKHKIGTKFQRPKSMTRYILQPHLLYLDHPDLKPEMTPALRALISRPSWSVPQKSQVDSAGDSAQFSAPVPANPVEQGSSAARKDCQDPLGSPAMPDDDAPSRKKHKKRKPKVRKTSRLQTSGSGGLDFGARRTGRAATAKGRGAEGGE